MKKRILSIVLTLCMVLMFVPQTVFAEGGTTPTYDLWQVDGKVYYAVTGEHTDFNTAGDTELPDWSNPVCYQFPGSGTYVLQTDITLTSSRRMIQFETSDITLDLNGKTATSYGSTFSFITAENVTILDSVGEGTINGEVGLNDNCSLILKSGTIYALRINGDSTFYADGGKIETVNEAYHATITQNNGTAGTEFNGLVNLKAGTFSGGLFYGTVGSGGGPNSSTISGGVFYGEVENKANSTISGGVFYGTVVSGCGSNNSSTISGGVFYGEVENKANSTISGGVFYGGIQDNGGTITDPYHTVSFDLNGASGTAPVTQYFVNTNTAQALEPATEPTREGYEFAGWYNGDTKYDFTENVTGNITLKAEWKSIEAPVIKGLEDKKTYCDTVQFEVSDNVGVTSVTANGDTLTPDSNGKYSLEKGKGTVTVVVKDKANNETSVTVTVNDGHTGGTATCTQKAKCGICGEEYGELTNHSLVKTDAKTPTCTEDGNIEYWTCSVCHKLFSDENGTNETTFEAVTIKATGHPLTKTEAKDATCTEDGNTAYWTCSVCNKYFSDETGTNEIEKDSWVTKAAHKLTKTEASAATVTATGNKEYWHCKDCGKYFADENGTKEIKLEDTIISKLSPEIIEGKGQSITAGEKKELTFKSNAAFSDFIRVELDGETLAEKNYTVKEGSTVVTLKADYVATLSTGEHTIGIVSTNGTASTTFTVNAKTVVDNDTKSPQTGDNSHMVLWFALLFASGAGVIGTAVYGKKKRSAK